MIVFVCNKETLNIVYDTDVTCIFKIPLGYTKLIVMGGDINQVTATLKVAEPKWDHKRV